MATTIQIKRSSTASGVPLATDLAVGELAVNLADKRLFTKQSDGTIIELSTNPTDLDAATLRIDGVEITASATELNSLDGFTGSTTELNILDGLTATTIELNTLDGITASTAELNKLDGYTGSTAELNILDGVTATTAEINKLDGFTGVVDDLNYAKDLRATGVTTTEFDKLDGLTATTTELNILDGVTATTAELNITDGLTATTTELNTLDGITATTTELNYTDGVTSNIQTQLDGKATTAQGALADSAVQPNDDVSFGTGSFSGAVDVTGTVTTDGLTVDGNGTIQSNASSSVPTLTLKDTDTSISVGQSLGRLSFSSADASPDASGERAYIEGTLLSGGVNYGIEIGAMASGGSPTKRLTVSGSGNVSFYEDTGTTAKMVWDASAESLGIGTASPSGLLTLNNASGAAQLYIRSENSSDSSIIFGAQDDVATGSISYFHSDDSLRFNGYNNTERMRINSNGNVGIGTASPRTQLDISSTSPTITLTSPAINWAGGEVLGGIDWYTLDSSGIGAHEIGNIFLEQKGTSSTPVVDMVFATSTANASPTERMRIDSTGNVGIGTASPSCALSVATNGGSWTTSSSDGVGINYNSGNANISTYLDNSTLKIGAGVTQKNGLTIYGQTGGNRIQFDVAGSERARIDSSGNLLIGKTTLNGNVAGFQVEPAGALAVTRSGSVTAYFNRQTSDGDIAVFRKDGSTVGSIGSTSSQLYIGSTVSGVRFGSSTVFPANSDGSSSDADTDLGTSSVRFKDLYLGGGVYLGGTGAANKLDDYEEGTWTPSVEGSTTAGSFSSVYAAGEYVKVGRKVTCSFSFNGTSGTGSGELRLEGLPFSIDFVESGGPAFANSGLVFNSGYIPVWIKHDTSSFKIRAMNPSGGNYQPVSYNTTMGYLRGNFTYFTNQ